MSEEEESPPPRQREVKGALPDTIIIRLASISEKPIKGNSGIGGRPRKDVDPGILFYLRELGLSWPQIAKELKCSPDTVQSRYKALKDAEKPKENPNSSSGRILLLDAVAKPLYGVKRGDEKDKDG